ncbi:DNA-binding transcriptional regulator, MarR family [Sinosporangium album]|uniref:DNA-binding transcriptional regulator, MarR family n=1 Tax=Sinosporangium album TaxID=504805 RepID=A0A1G7XHN2_9ACTN|nr:MarR family transcriptional regulator [Sinosporangium album]SDG83591.1 DNA-binding transcriptional regulator, MarR family [Sinosporangium album]
MPGETTTSPRGFKVAVWRSLMETHVFVLREIETELQQRHRLSLSEFDALVNIPAEGTRLVDLKKRVVLSQSAVSRLCDRLEQRGLVERIPCPEDQRGVEVRVTPAGRKLLRQAVRTNADVVERAFADHLSPAQLDALHDALATVRMSQAGA